MFSNGQKVKFTSGLEAGKEGHIIHVFPEDKVAQVVIDRNFEEAFFEDFDKMEVLLDVDAKICVSEFDIAYYMFKEWGDGLGYDMADFHLIISYEKPDILNKIALLVNTLIGKGFKTWEKDDQNPTLCGVKRRNLDAILNCFAKDTQHFRAIDEVTFDEIAILCDFIWKEILNKSFIL